MSVRDNDGLSGFDEALRRELAARVGDDSALGRRVFARIADRSPRRVRRDRDERRVRHLAFGAAMVFGALVAFHAVGGPLNRSAEMAQDPRVDVPAIVEFEDQAEELSDPTSILAALLFDRRTP